MTRETALDRLRKLLALAGPNSGATEEERRTAAVQAVRVMVEHGLQPTVASWGSSPQPAIDFDKVTALAFRVLELEQQLAESERQRVRDVLGARALEARRRGHPARGARQRSSAGQAGHHDDHVEGEKRARSERWTCSGQPAHARAEDGDRPAGRQGAMGTVAGAAGGVISATYGQVAMRSPTNPAAPPG
jgi:hypothetical protein